MKKLITIILVALITLTLALPAFADAQFGQPSSWAVTEVNEAIAQGWVPASLQGNYQQSITRIEFVELYINSIFTGFNYYTENDNSYGKLYWPVDKMTTDYFLQQVEHSVSFVDTDSDYAVIAKILGITKGVTATEFDPSGLLTREQICTFMMNYQQRTVSSRTDVDFSKFNDVSKFSTWAKEAVLRAASANLVKGKKIVMKKMTNPANGNTWEELDYSVFDPKGTLTREEAILIVRRAYNVNNGKTYIVFKGKIEMSFDHFHMGMKALENTLYLKNANYVNEYSTWREGIYSYVNLQSYYTENKIPAKNFIASGLTMWPDCTAETLEKIKAGNSYTLESSMATYALFPNNEYLVIVEVKPATEYISWSHYSGGVYWSYSPTRKAPEEIETFYVK